jgi:hypothetical protein
LFIASSTWFYRVIVTFAAKLRRMLPFPPQEIDAL